MEHDKTTAKLAANQAATKRWHSRLVRATNELSWLAKQRQRLEASLTRPKPASAPAAKPEPVAAPLTVPVKQPEAPKVSEDDLDVRRTFLARNMLPPVKDEPQLVDKLKAKRKPVDKKAMPLSGRAALDAIRKPARVKAR